jgi:WhiB family transcriptional regulator, redox-sensing transcriptional regulator
MLPHRLPGPIEQAWTWQFRGACRGEAASVFFHPDNERGPARRARENRAKEFCARCEVLLECREFALATKEPYGVWGGLTENERWEILRAEAHIPRPGDRDSALDRGGVVRGADRLRLG